MDVRHQILSLTALSSLNADALLLVVAGDSLDTKLDPKLAAPIDDALAQGDFVLKAGRTLYFHRQPGVRAGPPLGFPAGSGSGRWSPSIRSAEQKGCRSTLSALVARPERFELPTTKFVAWCSIQLSYGRRSGIMQIVSSLRQQIHRSTTTLNS